jgi:hypothetical protein
MTDYQWCTEHGIKPGLFTTGGGGSAKVVAQIFRQRSSMVDLTGRKPFRFHLISHPKAYARSDSKRVFHYIMELPVM